MASTPMTASNFILISTPTGQLAFSLVDARTLQQAPAVLAAKPDQESTDAPVNTAQAPTASLETRRSTRLPRRDGPTHATLERFRRRTMLQAFAALSSVLPGFGGGYRKHAKKDLLTEGVMEIFHLREQQRILLREKSALRQSIAQHCATLNITVDLPQPTAIAHDPELSSAVPICCCALCKDGQIDYEGPRRQFTHSSDAALSTRHLASAQSGPHHSDSDESISPQLMHEPLYAVGSAMHS
jgi:hypothetical protein